METVFPTEPSGGPSIHFSRLSMETSCPIPKVHLPLFSAIQVLPPDSLNLTAVAMEITEHLSLQGFPSRVLSYSVVTIETVNVSMTTDLQLSGTSCQGQSSDWSCLLCSSGAQTGLRFWSSCPPQFICMLTVQQAAAEHRPLLKPLQHFKLSPVGETRDCGSAQGQSFPSLEIKEGGTFLKPPIQFPRDHVCSRVRTNIQRLYSQSHPRHRSSQL